MTFGILLIILIVDTFYSDQAKFTQATLMAKACSRTQRTPRRHCL
jgi:hypothetical protein